MKVFCSHWTARGLPIALVILICAALAPVGSAWAGKNAQVQVGFVGVPPTDPHTGKALFQNVLLNVAAVRINPQVNAGPNNGKWQSIPTPPGIGGANSNAELQIDLNTSQNVPQLFNTAGVKPNTYMVAELDLDTNNPGTLIPNCPLAPPVGSTADGCINYPIQLNSGVIISAPITGGLSAMAKGTAQLVLQVTMQLIQTPTAPGAPYTVSVTITPFTTQVLGTVMGSVTVMAGGTGSGSSTTKVRKLAVTAEAIGTNTAIATVPVKNGSFSLSLPAGGPPSPLTPFGTLYDLAVAGGGDSYAAIRLPPLYPGQSITVPAPSFKVTGRQTLGNITGQITSNCAATTPIAGATLELLVPPDSNSGADCMATPDQCVTVASANTDNAGNFPLPGTITTPPEFENVPALAKGAAYAMKISAPGYDTTFVQAKPSTGTGKKNGGTCEAMGATSFSPCNIALDTGLITGTIPIIPPPPGQTTLVQVFAEDHGTNTIESALPMPVRVSSTNPGTLNFTLNVPTTNTVPGGFDLFATTIDLYQGVSDPYQGHTIAVKAGVPAPPPRGGAPVCTPEVTAFAADQTINCIGHGSVVGTVAGANLGTSVVLSKEDPDAMSPVQIATSMVENQSSPPQSASSNSYAFCVPADTYQLQTVQIPMPSPSVAPSVAPTSEPTGSPTISVTIPPAPLFHAPPPTPTATATGATPTATATGGATPTATATPTITPTPNPKCPTTCSNADGSCPGICNTVVQPLAVP